jgi:hypothetical protein
VAGVASLTLTSAPTSDNDDRPAGSRRGQLGLLLAGILLASIATYPALKFLRGLLFGTADLGVSTVAWAASVVSILVMLAAYLPGREVIKLTLRDLLTDN